jgi:hypothetical protein
MCLGTSSAASRRTSRNNHDDMRRSCELSLIELGAVVRVIFKETIGIFGELLSPTIAGTEVWRNSRKCLTVHYLILLAPMIVDQFASEREG